MLLSQLPFIPELYSQYIRELPNCPLPEALHYSRDLCRFIPKDSLEKLKGHRYEPGKWTVGDILQHLIDTERILAYQSLRVARGDTAPLPGFDENKYALNTLARERSLSDLLEEYQLVRQSTIMLFQSFSNKALLRTGICAGQQVSVASLGFMIAGHAAHHTRIIQERYVSQAQIE